MTTSNSTTVTYILKFEYIISDDIRCATFGMEGELTVAQYNALPAQHKAFYTAVN